MVGPSTVESGDVDTGDFVHCDHIALPVPILDETVPAGTHLPAVHIPGTGVHFVAPGIVARCDIDLDDVGHGGAGSVPANGGFGC